MPGIIEINRTGTGSDLVDFVSVGLSPEEKLNFTHNYSNSNPNTLVVTWYSGEYTLEVIADCTLSTPQLNWMLPGMKSYLDAEHYDTIIQTARLELYHTLNEIVRNFNKNSDREPADVYQSLREAMLEFMRLLAIDGKLGF